MKTWVVAVGVLLVAPLATRGQSVTEFPRYTAVHDVTVIGTMLFFDLEPIIPQQDIKRWWKEMEVCTGITRSFDGVDWYVADVILDLRAQQTNFGLYYYRPPEIILLRGQTPEQIENTVKHEVLHHLINDFEVTHDEEQFTRCLSGSPS